MHFSITVSSPKFSRVAFERHILLLTIRGCDMKVQSRLDLTLIIVWLVGNVG